MAKTCRYCKSKNVRRSKRRGLFERLIGFLGINPYRCRSCGSRFFKFL